MAVGIHLYTLRRNNEPIATQRYIEISVYKQLNTRGNWTSDAIRVSDIAIKRA